MDERSRGHVKVALALELGFITGMLEYQDSEVVWTLRTSGIAFAIYVKPQKTDDNTNEGFRYDKQTACSKCLPPPPF